jgi:hypothetical protein
MKMVQVKQGDGTWEDIMEEMAMEEAILASMFMTNALVTDFGILRKGSTADEVLTGTYNTPESIVS